MKHLLIILVLSLFIGSVYSNKLKIVNDSELMDLTKLENNVIAFYTKPDCESCDEVETNLESIEDALKKEAGAIVVKIVSSPFVSVHKIVEEPGILFYRRSYPLKYSGPMTAYAIFTACVKRRNSPIKDLTDDDFEDKTQAANVSTAKDWFIFFYSHDCEDCKPLLIIWEGVGLGSFNVGRMNMENASLTAERFKINEVPAFLFLSQGKYYRYNEISYCPTSYIDFAENIHSQSVEGEMIPPIVSVSKRIDVVNEGISLPWVLMLAVLGAAGVGFIYLFKYLALDRQRYPRTETKALIVE